MAESKQGYKKTSKSKTKQNKTGMHRNFHPGEQSDIPLHQNTNAKRFNALHIDACL